MVCHNCKKQFDDNKAFCPFCYTGVSQKNYSIIVRNVNPSRIDSLNIIIKEGNLSPQEAKDLAENVPFVLKTGIPYEEANNIKNKLEQVKVISEIQETPTAGNVQQADFYSLQVSNPAEKQEAPPEEDDVKISTMVKDVCKETLSDPESRKEFFSGLFKVVMGIILICVTANFISFLKGTDTDSSTESVAESYIAMVQELTPFENGKNYEEAFSGTFDTNEWSYFEADGEQFVQVNSYSEELDLNFVTQFLLTPTENEDEYLIEAYAMKVGEYNLSTDEMLIVFAGIYNNEVLQSLEELIGY